MKLLRDALVKGALIAAILAFQMPAFAFWHGSSITKPGSTVVNLNGSTLAFLNLAHTMTDMGSTQAGWPGALNADGYPTSAVTQNITSDTLLPIPNYYGRYKAWWTGSGALELSPPVIVYSGGTSTQLNSAAGSMPFNAAFGFAGATTQPTSSSPIEFSYGGLISAISDAGSCTGGTAGLVCLTSSLSNEFANISTGQIAQVNNITNLADGPWTLTKLDSQHVELQGSSYNAGMAVVGGGPGPQSEVIYNQGAITWTFPAQGSFSTNYASFDNMVICRSQNVGYGGSSDCANVGSHDINPDYVSVFKQPNLNPRWIRVMNPQAVQGSWATSYANRATTSLLAWDSVHTWLPGYWGGLITRNVSDSFTTANNPSSSPASGPPVDGEVVTGYIDSTSAPSGNTTENPTLAVNRPSFGSAMPILDYQAPLYNFTISGSLPATGSIISIVFSGGPFASPTTYQYGVNSNATNSYTGSISGTVLTANAPSAGAITIGQIITASCITEYAQVQSYGTGSGGAGTYNIAFPSGGSASGCSSVSFTGKSPYTAYSGQSTPDTSFNNIVVNIREDFIGSIGGAPSTPNAGPFNNAGITMQNPEMAGGSLGQFDYNPNINSSGAATLSSGFAISASDSTSTGTYTIGTIPAGTLAAGHNIAFTFCGICQAWIAADGGANGSITFLPGPHSGWPLEAYEDLATQANVGIWLNIPLLYSDASVYDTVQNIAASGVKELVLEVSNETWNTGGGGQWHAANNLAQRLGLKTASQNQGGADTFTGLRIIQIAQQARAAWSAAGRSQSQLFISLAYQFVNPNVTYRFDGSTELQPSSNATFAAYGGAPSNGTTTPSTVPTDPSTGQKYDYSAFPNRPRDWSDFLSPAPYWAGGELNAGNGSDTLVSSAIANYDCLLVAAYNYANGTTTDQGNALNWIYNPGLNTGDLYNGTLNGSYPSSGTYTLANYAHGSGTGGADYYGITSIVAADDASRTGTDPHTDLPWQLLGVAGYEGDADPAPINSNGASSFGTQFSNMGDTNGYTSGLAGNYCGLSVVSGGPASTPAQDGTNVFNLLTAFKNDSRFESLYARYFSDFKTAIDSQGVRLEVPGTYDVEGLDYWSKYPGSIYSTPFKSWNAIQANDN